MSLSKILYPLLSTGSTQECNVKNQRKQNTVIAYAQNQYLNTHAGKSSGVRYLSFGYSKIRSHVLAHLYILTD